MTGGAGIRLPGQGDWGVGQLALPKGEPQQGLKGFSIMVPQE